MTIRAKVTGCFVVLLAILLGTFLYNYERAKASTEKLTLVNELFLPLSRAIVQLQTSAQGLTEDMARHFESDKSPGTSATNSTFSRVVRDLYPYLILKRVKSIEAMLHGRETLAIGTTVKELSERLTRTKAAFEEILTVGQNAIEPVASRIQKELKELATLVDGECQRITLEAQRENSESLFLSLVMTCVAMAFGIFTLWLSHRSLEPLPVLAGKIRNIADGDFNQGLKVRPSDKSEVALLAREYNRMLQALQERDAKIQKQQKDLVQAERLGAIGQLSAEIVHEIRNPLNSISLNIDWLSHGLEDADPEIGRTLASISKEVERLHLITESYLVKARLPGRDDQSTGIHDLVREILDFSREEYRQKNISVETELFNEEIYVRFDRSRLKQAFINVFRNSREAMPNGGSLKIRSEIVENVLKLEVIDTGHGMNEPMKRRAFNPFFTTKPNGTGLGLMLTRTIVEEANGSIECDSQVGQGTKFTFQFPIDREVRGEC